eukprot:COSAG05_NODE_9295_length_634_cov_0.852336_1_plen_38_part_10
MGVDCPFGHLRWWRQWLLLLKLKLKLLLLKLKLKLFLL